MKLKALLFLSFSLLIISCEHLDPNGQVDEGNIQGAIYESKEIGWSIKIPKGWSIVSKDKAEKNEEKGRDAIEKTLGSEIDTKRLKHLISFQKNQFNLFSSTIEPFKEEFPGEYQQNNKALCELLYKTFTDQGIKTDTSSGKEKIQGLEFNTFHTTIYAPDGKIILRQIMYCRLTNGYDFGVNISYNNEQDKTTLTDAWKKSKFLK
jgi:hypothetical protein